MGDTFEENKRRRYALRKLINALDSIEAYENYPCARCGNTKCIRYMDMICTGNAGEYLLICHKCLGKEITNG